MLAAGHMRADADESRVTLRRAVTGDRRLYDWAASNNHGRSEVLVEVLGSRADTCVAVWALLGARPVRWYGPDLDAIAAGVAIEELELSYDRLEWLYPTT